MLSVFTQTRFYVKRSVKSNRMQLLVRLPGYTVENLLQRRGFYLSTLDCDKCAHKYTQRGQKMHAVLQSITRSCPPQKKQNHTNSMYTCSPADNAAVHHSRENTPQHARAHTRQTKRGSRARSVQARIRASGLGKGRAGGPSRWLHDENHPLGDVIPQQRG